MKTYVKPLLNGETFPAESINSSLVKMLAVSMNIYLWYLAPANSSGSKSKKQDKRETPMGQSLTLCYRPLRTEVKLVKPDKKVSAHND